MYGHATQHVKGLLQIYIVVICQTLLRMSTKAKGGPSSKAGQSKVHLD